MYWWTGWSQKTRRSPKSSRQLVTRYGSGPQYRERRPGEISGTHCYISVARGQESILTQLIHFTSCLRETRLVAVVNLCECDFVLVTENSRRLGNAGDDGDLVRGTDEGAGLVNGSERVAPHLGIEGEDERLTLNLHHQTWNVCRSLYIYTHLYTAKY